MRIVEIGASFDSLVIFGERLPMLKCAYLDGGFSYKMRVWGGSTVVNWSENRTELERISSMTETNRSLSQPLN